MVIQSFLAVFLAVVSPHSADAWRVDLLEFAGASAEKLPLDPHIRNRSVAMLDVVDALLELGAISEAKRLGEHNNINKKLLGPRRLGCPPRRRLDGRRRPLLAASGS